jgi:20S proteasome subunit alpha 5
MMRTGRVCTLHKQTTHHTYSAVVANNGDRYHAEPSGTFYRYDAKAIGSGSEGAQAELQNEFHKSLTLPEAEVLTLKTLKQVMEEKLDSKNVQLASVTKDKGFRIYTDAEMAEVVGRLPTN